MRGFPSFSLFAAVRGDSLAIVRKLLDHGATVNGDWRLLDIAVKHEITAMPEFLLEHFDVRYNYVSIPDSDYRRVLKKAADNGLDSMLQVLLNPLEGLTTEYTRSTSDLSAD